jgi:SAM-dependent methyltransferase
VVATDIGTSFLTGFSAPNLHVVQHDVVTEDFPCGSFDLIHARWLLVNLSERERVLTKIVTWLAPGGWLVTEELDHFPMDSSPHLGLRRFITAVEQLLADSHGADFRWARRRLPAALAEAGLGELGMAISVKQVGDGGPANVYYRMLMAQLHSELVNRGLLSENEYTATITLLDSPTVIDALFANIAVWGRRSP